MAELEIQGPVTLSKEFFPEPEGLQSWSRSELGTMQWVGPLRPQAEHAIWKHRLWTSAHGFFSLQRSPTQFNSYKSQFIISSWVTKFYGRKHNTAKPLGILQLTGNEVFLPLCNVSFTFLSSTLLLLLFCFPTKTGFLHLLLGLSVTFKRSSRLSVFRHFTLPCPVLGKQTFPPRG